MLKFSVLVVSLFAMTMVVSESQTLAGRHFSKELGLEEAKSNYNKATTLEKRVEAYKNLRRFEPEDMAETEKNLALSLANSSDKEHRKLAVELYGRSLITKKEFEPKEIDPFCRVVHSFLSLTNQGNLIQEYLISCRDKNVQQIRSASFQLLELLNDIPEGCEVILSASSAKLGEISSDEQLVFGRLLVERKKMWQPVILHNYLFLLEQNRKKIPLPSASIIDLYNTMLEDDRFRSNYNYICEYTSLCHKNKRFKAAKKLSIHVLEEERFDQEETIKLQFALAIAHTKLKEHEKAISIFEEIMPLFVDRASINQCSVWWFHNLSKLGNQEKITEAVRKAFQSSVSHLIAQRDNRKAEKRKKYVEAIKFDLAQREKVEVTPKVNNGKDEKKHFPMIVSKEVGDSFLEDIVKLPFQSNGDKTRAKSKTRKQANLTLNTKRNAQKTKKKGEKEKEENSVKKNAEYRTAEELPNSSYKTLVKIFSIFVGETKWGSCKITVEEVAHLFESMGYTYSNVRGRGGHSMIFCNDREEEGALRKAFTFGSKKTLHPAAVPDLASFLLEYRIYPAQFENALKQKKLL